jgi:hypothetical protein
MSNAPAALTFTHLQKLSIVPALAVLVPKLERLVREEDDTGRDRSIEL